MIYVVLIIVSLMHINYQIESAIYIKQGCESPPVSRRLAGIERCVTATAI